MIFSKKIVKIGKSSGIIVDKKILNEMRLNNKDWVEIKIKKILN